MENSGKIGSLSVRFSSAHRVESHEVERQAFVWNSFVQTLVEFLEEELADLQHWIVLKSDNFQ
jgi:hypothetical protein